MMNDKKQSLLKPYTNFDKIKAMTVEEMASLFTLLFNKGNFLDRQALKRKDIIKKWLESEAEE